MPSSSDASKSQNQQAILRASIVAMLAAIQLITFNNYIVIFLSEELLLLPLLVTLIISSRNFLQIFFRIPLGEISQTIGRKPVILFGHIAFTFALLLLYFSKSFLLAFIATLCVAVGMSAFWPAIFGYVSDWTPNTFGHSNGRIFQFWDIGIIISTFLAKYLLDFVKIELRALFIFVGLIGIISTFLAISILPSSYKEPISWIKVPIMFKDAMLEMFHSFVDVSKTSLLEVYAFQILLAFLQFMVVAFFPLLIVAQGFTKGTVSEIMLYVTVLLFLFKPKFGKLTDKLNFLPTIIMMLFVCSLTVLIMPILTSLWQFTVVYIVYSSFVITGYTALNGETSRRASKKLQGTALGTLGVYVSLGRTISTISLGPIWEFVSLEAVFWFTGLLIIVLTLLFSIVNFNHKNAKLAQEQKH